MRQIIVQLGQIALFLTLLILAVRLIIKNAITIYRLWKERRAGRSLK